MVFDELIAEIFKGALRDFQVDKKRREGKKRREPKKKKRIQELEDGEDEYEVALIERYINTLEERDIELEEVSFAAVNFVDRLDRATELARANQ